MRKKSVDYNQLGEKMRAVKPIAENRPKQKPKKKVLASLLDINIEDMVRDANYYKQSETVAVISDEKNLGQVVIHRKGKAEPSYQWTPADVADLQTNNLTHGSILQKSRAEIKQIEDEDARSQILALFS